MIRLPAMREAFVLCAVVLVLLVAVGGSIAALVYSLVEGDAPVATIAAAFLGYTLGFWRGLDRAEAS